MKYNQHTAVYNASTSSMLRSARVLLLKHSSENQSEYGDLPDMINFVLDTVMVEVLEVQSRTQQGHRKARSGAQPSAEEVLLSTIARIHHLIALYRTAGCPEEQANTGIAIWSSFELVLATYSRLFPVEGFTSSHEARELYACSSC